MNDLDLIVTDEGQSFSGNNFLNGWSIPGLNPDPINNLENVYIQNPGVTTYTLTVVAARIGGDGVPDMVDISDQDFALICSNCILAFDIQPGLNISPSEQTQAGSFGSMVKHQFTLENVGNYADTFFLQVEGNEWQLQVPKRVGPGKAGATTEITATVKIPNSLLEGSVIYSDTFTLTATSQLSNVVSSQAEGITLALVDTGVELSPNQSGEGYPGAQVGYEIVLTNTGSCTDTFILSVDSAWISGSRKTTYFQSFESVSH